MEEAINWAHEIYAKYGLGGLLLTYFLWDKLIYPKFLRWKKGEHYVSFKDISDLKDKFKMLNNKIERHLEKEAIEDIRLGTMENQLDNQEKRMDKQTHDMETMFTLISNIKDKMIEMGYGKR